MNYYRHHIGDYLVETSHLTFMEDAAYSRLLRLYYHRETPFPADVAAIQRLSGARGKTEKAAVEIVLNEFFEMQEDGWHHVQADAAIAMYHDNAETSRENGKKGGRPKKPEEPVTNPPGNPERTQQKPSNNPEKTQTKANQEPITSNQEPTRKQKQQQNQKQPPYTPQAKNVTGSTDDDHSPSSADAAERHAALLDESFELPESHPPDGEPPPDPQTPLLPVPPVPKTVRDQRIVDILVDAYHYHLPYCQHVSALPPKRRRRILHADKMARTLCKQQGLSYHPEDYWDDYFACCARDRWLNGTESNPNNPRWKQNIEVLLDEKRFAQIMDDALWQMKKAA